MSLRRTLLWAGAVLAFVAAGFCSTLFAAHGAGELLEATKTTTLVVRGGALDETRAAEVLDAHSRQEEPSSFVLWQELSLATLENPTLGRTAEVGAVLAEGNVALLVAGALLPEGARLGGDGSAAAGGAPEGALGGAPGGAAPEGVPGGAAPEGALGGASEEVPGGAPGGALEGTPGGASEGALGQAADAPACIIDRATALALFGSANIDGLTVRYNGEDFAVAQVVESARPLLLIRPTPTTGTAFDRVTVLNPSGLPAESVEERLTLETGLSLEALDFALLYHLARLLCWLPLLAVATLYLLFLLGQGLAKGNTVRVQVAFLLGFLGGGVLLTVFVGSNVALPREFIPSRVSDFSLWQQLFDRTGSALRLLFDTPTLTPTAAFYDNFFASVGLSVLSLAAFAGAVWLLTLARGRAYPSEHPLLARPVPERPAPAHALRGRGLLERSLWGRGVRERSLPKRGVFGRGLPGRTLSKCPAAPLPYVPHVPEHARLSSKGDGRL